MSEEVGGRALGALAAAPVFDRTGDLKPALTAIGPAPRLDIAPGATSVARRLRRRRGGAKLRA